MEQSSVGPTGVHEPPPLNASNSRRTPKSQTSSKPPVLPATTLTKASTTKGINDDMRQAIKAGLLSTQMSGRVSEQTQDSIKAGLLSTQMSGRVSEQTQDSIKSGLLSTQMSGRVSEELVVDDHSSTRSPHKSPGNHSTSQHYIHPTLLKRRSKQANVQVLQSPSSLL